MNKSLVLEWLDENAKRAFPLKENPNNPDTSVIVDALLLAPDGNDVLLNTIVKNTNSVSINTSIGAFETTLPVAGNVTIRNSFGVIVLGDGINNIPEGTTTFSNVYFESCVAIPFVPYWTGLNSIKFGDLDVMQGDVHLLPRYQTNLSAVDNNLVWKVGKQLGIPLDKCDSYGPDGCGTQVSYINGIPPIKNEFKFTTAPGLKVTPDKDNNKLIISLDFNAVDICASIPPIP